MTKSKDDPVLAVIAKENESLFCDADFIVEEQEARRHKIDQNVLMIMAINGQIQKQTHEV